MIQNNEIKLHENAIGPVLKVENLGIVFGGLHAVEDFNIEIYQNQIIGLIGPNGAGKTTVFNMLTGVYQPTTSSIYINGEKLPIQNDLQHTQTFKEKIKNKLCGKKLKPHTLVKYGVARTFQNIRLFKQMTVLENVIVAFHQQMKSNIISSTFRFPSYYEEEEKYKMRALELLSIFNLLEYASTKASNLAYGQQRRLEIARAMATQPKVLLLDEPAAGMNPTETQDLLYMIEYVRSHYNIAILLIEHDMNLVMNICEKITVLEYGKVIACGTPEEISNNKRVIEAYLGAEDDDSE